MSMTTSALRALPITFSQWDRGLIEPSGKLRYAHISDGFLPAKRDRMQVIKMNIAKASHAESAAAVLRDPFRLGGRSGANNGGGKCIRLESEEPVLQGCFWRLL